MAAACAVPAVLLLTGLLPNSSGHAVGVALLEWSAACFALMVAGFALVQYRSRHDAALPILACSLFCAAAMDAFPILTASTSGSQARRSNACASPSPRTRLLKTPR